MKNYIHEIIDEIYNLENEYLKGYLAYHEFIYEVYKLSPNTDKRTTKNSFQKSEEKKKHAKGFFEAITETAYYKYLKNEEMKG